MPRYLGPLRAELVDDRREGGRQLWKLTEPLAFDSDVAGIIIADAGFETDYGSIPRLPCVWLVFSDYGHKPAVTHDKMYRDWQRELRHGKIDYGQAMRRKKLADDVFDEALKAIGVPDWRRIAMVLAVRTFGGRRLPKLPFSQPPAETLGG